jgi:hypothetical protein
MNPPNSDSRLQQAQTYDYRVNYEAPSNNDENIFNLV